MQGLTPLVLHSSQWADCYPVYIFAGDVSSASKPLLDLSQAFLRRPRDVLNSALSSLPTEQTHQAMSM